MTTRVLAEGPPPLTEEAADAALDAIDFIAAAVRGIDTIDVTPTIRTLWREHIANTFAYLPPWTRAWFANAPFLITTLRMQWPFLQPAQQAMMRQGWMADLPAMLQMLEPVLRQTDDQLSPAIQPDLDAMRNVAGPTAPAADPELSATQQVFNHSVNSETLRVGSKIMTTATIDLMQAMGSS